MRRVLILIVALAMLAGSGLASAAQENAVPDHPHMLVLGIEIGEVGGSFAITGWRKCIDLAAGHPVPLNAHHEHLHFGPVNDVLFDNAGHAVLGGAPFGPWAGCAGLESALPIVFG